MDLAQALCIFCSMTGSLPEPQVARSAGDIWFTHERLGRSSHLLRLSTTDVILDSNGARDLRLDKFARGFAEQTCQDSFDLAVAEQAAWPETRPLYAKQYVFRCRKPPK